MSNNLIKPRTLKGFRDFLPEAMIPREKLIDTAKQVYRSYGFSPIDTPVLEYDEILRGKGGEETERQMYSFDDNGGRKVGMRFDLTVPLARFVAQHSNALGTPFKRYQIAAVWRGESPQAGRYREFMQCDFDTIGTTSVTADIETGLVINDLMRAIGFEDFAIRVNNRKVLNGLLEKLDLQEKAVQVLRSIDKLAKIGPEKVLQEICDSAGATREKACQVLALTSLSGSNQEIVSQLSTLVSGNEKGEEGVEELNQLAKVADQLKINQIQFDVSIARGLDYYTGTIFETFLGQLPSIGSVCSGGRYDNLAELYTKLHLPGIGASLGLDRLLTAMETLELIEPIKTTAPVMIVNFDKDYLSEYLTLADEIRKTGIGVEVYPDTKKLAKQMKYATQRGFTFAIIAGSEEFEAKTCQVKNLEKREQKTVALEEVARHIEDALG